MLFLDTTCTKFQYKQFWACLGLVALLCILCMLFIDRPVLLWVQFTVTPAWKAWFKFITQFGEASYFLLPSAGICIFSLLYNFLAPAGRKGKWYEDKICISSLFFFSAVALSGIVVNILKVLFGRPRPYYFLARHDYGFHFMNFKFYMNSFPSGHSQAVWSAVMALCILYPRFRYIGIPFGILISASRVFTKYHFCSDVIMGAFVGIVTTIALYRWFVQKGFLTPVEGKSL